MHHGTTRSRDHMITWHTVTLYFSEEGGDIDEAYSDINDSKSGMRDENEEK